MEFNIIDLFIKRLTNKEKISKDLFDSAYAIMSNIACKIIYTKDIEYIYDIVNEFLTRFIENIDTYRGTTSGQFINFYKISLKNMNMDIKKKRKTHVVDLTSMPIIDKRTDTVNDISISEENHALLDCIETLPEKKKMVVYELYFSKMKKKDISLKYGIHQTDMAKYLRSIYSSLKKCLELKNFNQEIVFTGRT